MLVYTLTGPSGAGPLEISAGEGKVHIGWPEGGMWVPLEAAEQLAARIVYAAGVARSS